MRATGSEMNTLRKVLAIVCITPMAAFGVAACGGVRRAAVAVAAAVVAAATSTSR